MCSIFVVSHQRRNFLALNFSRTTVVEVLPIYQTKKRWHFTTTTHTKPVNMRAILYFHPLICLIANSMIKCFKCSINDT